MGLLYNNTAAWPFPMPVTASTIASTASDPQVFNGALTAFITTLSSLYVDGGRT